MKSFDKLNQACIHLITFLCQSIVSYDCRNRCNLCGVTNLNLLSAKKQMTQFASAKFKKNVSSKLCLLRIQRRRAKTVDLDQGAYWAASSVSMLFANSAVYVSST